MAQPLIIRLITLSLEARSAFTFGTGECIDLADSCQYAARYQKGLIQQTPPNTSILSFGPFIQESWMIETILAHRENHWLILGRILRNKKCFIDLFFRKKKNH
ncbi:hypothetical protein GZ78_12450 [Endozoicomonas numazuensis]|uniref:Uncharacterized protein n=1 Tax=Endozoicomonas numazuensis TaxID=1137799 RepID=A0A081NIQ1_9GAMM|nr:hypothetical protein GZ78_12450 [Endozoicomonas numazuensis]